MKNERIEAMKQWTFWCGIISTIFPPQLFGSISPPRQSRQEPEKIMLCPVLNKVPSYTCVNNKNQWEKVFQVIHSAWYLAACWVGWTKFVSSSHAWNTKLGGAPRRRMWRLLLGALCGVQALSPCDDEAGQVCPMSIGKVPGTDFDSALNLQNGLTHL